MSCAPRAVPCGAIWTVTVLVEVTVDVVVLPAAQPASVRAATTTPRVRIRATVLPAAVGAEADDLDAMVGRDEAVPLGSGGHPVVEPALLHLDHAMAPLAEQMVVMLVAAEAVALLAAVV